jgi:predicted outer membrane protein
MPPVINPVSAEYMTTASGPLGPADRDLLVKVRQAGLWEMPAGDYAQTRAESARVKQVGAELREDHKKLDVIVQQVAKKLGVALPDEPSPEQQRWLAILAAESGPAFDRDYANLLRAAHGKVFSVIAGVRAGTRNDEIRKFASQSNTVVMKHMTLLESIGLVHYHELPEPPTPSPAPPVAMAVEKRRHA